MLKRSFDLTVALASLVFLFPILILIGIAVRLAMGSPVFFIQERVGWNGSRFRLIKFRTMRALHDDNGILLPDRERLGRFGKLLRISSLDELPELWNIVRGDMSFVGPRPLLTQYVQLYDARQSRRHEVRPGLTGWAQVNGRNAVDWPQRLEMDVWYVENQSLLLDLKILWLTVLTVLSRRGVSSDSHVTMEPFRGTANQDTEPAGDSAP